MPNSQLHTAVSVPRFRRYLVACKNNRRKAEKLYRLNLRLSQKLYAVIGLFEIILRNSIDRHLTSSKGERWLADAVKKDGFLEQSGCENSVRKVREVISKLGPESRHDRIIANLTLGFWTYHFSRKQFAAAGNTLLQIFPNRPRGLHQKLVFKNLVRINDIRNRVAHYEPVCFERSTCNIACDQVKRRYELIIDMLKWMGCEPVRILYGIDNVQKAIRDIDSLEV